MPYEEFFFLSKIFAFSKMLVVMQLNIAVETVFVEKA